jgi:hypothetical protein
MEIHLAPGMGLYLHELFFDGYNIKQRNEIENIHKRASAKISNKKKSAPISANVEVDITLEQVSKPLGFDDLLKDALDTENVEEIPPIKRQKINNEETGEGKLDSIESKEENEEEEEEDQLTSVHEEINWSTDPKSQTVIEDFVLKSIHPHIFEEASTVFRFSLIFIFKDISNLGKQKLKLHVFS